MGQDFFDMETLEPHCGCCNSKIEYGITTKYDDKKEAHVCKACGCVLK